MMHETEIIFNFKVVSPHTNKSRQQNSAHLDYACGGTQFFFMLQGPTIWFEVILFLLCILLTGGLLILDWSRNRCSSRFPIPI